MRVILPERCAGPRRLPCVEQVARFIDHDIKHRFPDGAVLRAELLRSDEIPGELIVRVFIPETEDVAAWAVTHREKMAEFRRHLSLRLPSARLLEFTSDAPDTEVITLPDDGTLADQQPTGREIVTKALELLRQSYVFPEVADQAAVAVEARLEAGEYDNLDEIALTDLLTEHLAEVCHDKHLRVHLGGGPRGPRPDGPRPDGAEPHPRRRPSREEMRKVGRLDNFGIHRVERLPGNVGYVDLRRMALAENAGPAIAAAMELVAGTFALIIDMRKNGGGHPDGVVFWCSYFFEEKTHLNDIYSREDDEIRQFWSLPYVPGLLYLDRPVYMLTSAKTFSGGEDLCYSLQAQGRAEVIGEATGGGAHPTRGFPVSAAVRIAIPHARSVNPVTGTNWEGIGVVPDTAVPADQAYDVAYAKALRHVLELDEVPPPIQREARETLALLPT
jgi:Peptidase family S41/N-terminal domain of Peptidase_S41 in eukaryotic IRBP